MNKRKRKKRQKKLIIKNLRELVTFYNELEEKRERIFNEALQELVNAPPERFSAAMRRYMEVTLYLASCEPPSRFYMEKCKAAASSPLT